MKTTIPIFLGKSLEKVMSTDAKIVALTSWYRHMTPYIPFVTGLLSENIDISADGIGFKSPQARYLYEGMLMVSPTTGSSWAQKNEEKVLTAIPLNFSHEQHPLACAKWGQVAADIHGDAIVRELKEYLMR